MPPKRKTSAPAGGGGKKAKTEPAAQQSSARQMADALKKAGGDDRKKTAKVDPHCHSLANSGRVVDDYDCMLNQTNIGNNNNKYYVIQVIESAGQYYVWNRWGRVGEPGADALKGPTTLESAVTDFKKKFQDKTKNKWDERDKFKAHPGKYTLLEMGEEDEDDDDNVDSVTPKAPAAKTEVSTGSHLPCKLDTTTQDLIKLIFDNDMFNDAMKNLEIDVKKMPLGKISKSQIAKGFEALEKIEDALRKNETSKLAELSSLFYTLIPHDFGRQRPPTIADDDTLRKKMDMLLVLADIEIAQSMQKEKVADRKAKTAKEPHPLDVKYDLLQCDLAVVDKKSKEYKILENYMKATEDYYKLQIQGIWEVDRSHEGERFSANKNVEHRKLLWHGTNVAVVAAILKGGLRIMPHSGGRVGKGLYFASENGKSAGYVRTTRQGKEQVGIMFLGEVALGKEHCITVGDGRLTQAPKGYDSIVARGRTEPDPKCDTTMILDGKKVIVPQGKPVHQPKYKSSQFGQSEYLIYREDQCRIRYVLKLKF